MAIPDTPGGEPFGAGALPTAENLGGQPEQSQRCVGTLHRSNGVAGVSGEALVGGSTVASCSPVGVAGAGLGNAHESAQRDWVARHHRAHLRVVVAVVGHRNRHARPALLAGKPARDSGVGVVTEIEVNGRGRSSVGFVDELAQQVCRRDRSGESTA